MNSNNKKNKKTKNSFWYTIFCSNCWIDPVSGSYHGLEWMLFAPTILCIIVSRLYTLIRPISPTS